MRLDFHTFDLPTNTTSFRDSKNILSSLIDIDFKNFASVIFIVKEVIKFRSYPTKKAIFIKVLFFCIIFHKKKVLFIVALGYL